MSRVANLTLISYFSSFILGVHILWPHPLWAIPFKLPLVIQTLKPISL